MSDDLVRRINDLLQRIEHAAVATVCDDGTPWNTPVFFAREGSALYWVSRRDAVHSTNIARDGHAFIVVFDSSHADASGACVYVEADAAELTGEDDIRHALEQIYRRRGKPAPSVAQFLHGSVHGAYRARAVRVWSNVLHTEDEIPWDERVEVQL
jgi:nitroimidazol reductase NimA-like FMN-containing flavoprotein (pyridoxamine 5'-phosphate oxidase superfamily)